MEKVVKKFSGFNEAEQADEQYYLSLNNQERLEIFFQLIGHSDAADGTVARHIRIYPLTESEES